MCSPKDEIHFDYAQILEEAYMHYSKDLITQDQLVRIEKKCEDIIQKSNSSLEC
ncbi:hypothetical protein [Candidatus Lokiarchaeum ossiferum]|uniref:hypothetical protein n=1 Tax=Candidatus Lokiarchaeum ossiferum TaxID=2951803 RepID=UPI00352C6733